MAVSEEGRFGLDYEVAAAAAGSVFRRGGYDLPTVHAVLASALDRAREYENDPEDPRREVLKVYGERLVELANLIDLRPDQVPGETQ